MGLIQSRREYPLFHRMNDGQFNSTDPHARTLEVLTNQEIERIAIEASLVDSPLPLDWEQSTGSGSTTYFIDHLNMTTTFSDPRIPNSNRWGRIKKKQQPPPYEYNFYSKCQHLRARVRRIHNDKGSLDISIRRDHLLADSYNLISNLDVLTLTRNLIVKYEDEPGLDYGGMNREWFMELSKEILSPKYGLFTQRGGAYYIEPSSSSICDYEKIFHFVGVILGMAAYHNKIFNCYFDPFIYRRFIDEHLDIHHLKDYDEAIYNSLIHILQVENSTVGLDLDFTIIQECQNPSTICSFLQNENSGEHGKLNGNHPDAENLPLITSPYKVKKKMRIIDFLPGGAEIPVTEQNKAQYVNFCFEHYACNGSKKQLEGLVEGFQTFMPPSLVKRILTPNELKLFIGGLMTIDVCDLEKNTVYQGGYESTSIVVIWFWQVAKAFTIEQVKLLLIFATGTDRVPIGGFRYLHGMEEPKKFTINKSQRIDGLPTAHSCFNRLDLPEYRNKKILEKNLIYAITETKGFQLQ